MEAYFLLQDDLRPLGIVLGVLVLIPYPRVPKLVAVRWVGLAFLLYGLTYFIPGTETWSSLPIFLIGATFFFAGGIDSSQRAKAEGKSYKWIVPAFAAVTCFWAFLGVDNFNRGKLTITVQDRQLVLDGRREGIHLPKEMVRILVRDGYWWIKDGWEVLTIFSWQRFESQGRIVEAATVIDRIEAWSGRLREPNVAASAR